MQNGRCSRRLTPGATAQAQFYELLRGFKESAMKQTKRKKKAEGHWTLWLLFLIPLVLILGKLPGMPTSDLFNSAFSLASVPQHMHTHLEYIIFVPLGALVVTFFRLTLGLRVFGIFRPILIAIAFKMIGITIGLIFLTCVLVVIGFTVRPILKARRMPYFARISVLLSSVVMLMIIPILAGLWLDSGSLVKVAYFPVVSLCLITESFAKTLKSSGPKTATLRCVMTVTVAIIVMLLAKATGGLHLLLRYPEILVVQIGCIVLVAEHLNLRLLEERTNNPNRASSPSRRGRTRTVAIEHA
jgi:hypothetical protein